jgi:hypothetical protein
MANAVNLAAARNSGSVVGQNLGTINNIFNASPIHPANQCIEALDVTDAMTDRASITCPVEGTCDWIEQHTSYQEWLSSTSKPLCVIGEPGEGKTSLAVHVSLALETASRNEKYTFAYFFCNYQDLNRNSACAVLRTILAQIIKQHPHSVVFAKDCFGGNAKADKRAERTLANREALWLMFCDMIRQPKLHGFTCMIDGLDECEGDSAIWLARKVSSLYTQFGATTKAPRFLITSRHIDPLEDLPSTNLDHLHSMAYQASIATFIKVRLDGLTRTSCFEGNFRRFIGHCLARSLLPQTVSLRHHPRVSMEHCESSL